MKIVLYDIMFFNSIKKIFLRSSAKSYKDNVIFVFLPTKWMKEWNIRETMTKIPLFIGKVTRIPYLKFWPFIPTGYAFSIGWYTFII